MTKENIKAFMKDCIPWRIRYYLKLLEAKGTISLGLKSHSDIEQYTNAFYNMVDGLGTTDFWGKTVCEMGCGQYLSNAILEYQMGADREYLLEIEDYANVGSPVKEEALLHLREGYKELRKLPEPEHGELWKSYLAKLNATYVTTGLEGYKSIPDDSVDYVFSVAVFEHIRRNVFRETLEEMYRFMKVGGASCQEVDFRDHLGGAKNHLRFSDDIWEDEIHYKMDNYTNRFSCSEIIKIMEEIGFKNIQVHKCFFDKPPIRRKKIHQSMKHISDDDILIRNAMIYAEK